jgi:hypothetical protein
MSFLLAAGRAVGLLAVACHPDQTLQFVGVGIISSREANAVSAVTATGD